MDLVGDPDNSDMGIKIVNLDRESGTATLEVPFVF